MKLIHVFILALIIIDINCGCGSYTDASVDNCKNAKTGDGYCCFVDAPKSNPSKYCYGLTKYQYDNIKVFVKGMKTFGGDNGETEDKDVKVDCKSFYLKLSLFILLSIFL